MKVVHHNKEHVESGEDLLAQATALEKDGELDKAASLYLRYLKKIPGNEYAFSRLMIIYRKQRDIKKETEIIDRAIKTFEEIFKKTTRIKPSQKTISISQKLMKAMGLTDKKGKELFEREPLKTWHKRKQTLMKRK
ncbi:MAG: hypothetical protein DI535_02575 [Citrobacter freundii]|nr:MAG: hypothetical protein DI535_02575 [Citrobacter freundii]